MNQENELPRMLLNADQLEQLDELLIQLGTDEDEDADLFIALGYITARAMEPQETRAADWLHSLFATEPPSSDAREQLLQLLDEAARSARQGFYQGGGIELPFETDWDEDSEGFIGDWCAGFMQAVFEQEELWLANQEQDIAELLLPLMALSGLFSEEEDFAEMEEDDALMAQFARQLPELLLDIYCQLNAPEEKPRTPPARSKKSSKNRRR